MAQTFFGIEVHSVTLHSEHKSNCKLKIEEDGNITTKKGQANLAQLVLVFKVVKIMINITHITCIFKICI